MAVYHIVSKDLNVSEVEVTADYVELNVDFFEFYNIKDNNKINLVAYYSSSMVYSVTEYADTSKHLKAV